MRTLVPAGLDGERVDKVVAMMTGLARGEVASLIGAGAVRIGSRVISTRSNRVSVGDEVEVRLPEMARAEPDWSGDGPEVPVVFLDDDLIVVDKPPAMVVHPGAGHREGTMAHGLLARFPELVGIGDPSRPGIVHRLDKGTSGLLVVARTAAAYESLVNQLSRREVERRYTALVWGHPVARMGLVDAPIGRSRIDPTRMAVSDTGREARTSYEIVEVYEEPVEVALLECRLETGRTHQIRVHLAAIGHPVVGDPRYRGDRRSFPVTRPFLHAHRLAFAHPATGAQVSFDSPLPPDLEAVLSRLSHREPGPRSRTE